MNEFSMTKLRQHLYGVVGWQFQAPGLGPAILSDLKKWRMVSSKSGEYDYNGTLTGVGFAGQAFRIADVSAAPLPGRDSTVDSGFRGVLISFRQNQPFKGRTIIAEDKGVFNPTTIDLMQRIPFDCVDFEHFYEVYSDCEVEANRVITGGMVKQLTEFSGLTFGQKAQCILTGQDVHFALQIDDRFHFSRVLEEQSFEKAKRAVLTEAGNICVLFEQLFRIQACIGETDQRSKAKQRLEFYKQRLKEMILEAGMVKLEDFRDSDALPENLLSNDQDALMSAHDPVRRKAS